MGELDQDNLPTWMRRVAWAILMLPAAVLVGLFLPEVLTYLASKGTGSGPSGKERTTDG